MSRRPPPLDPGAIVFEPPESAGVEPEDHLAAARRSVES